MDIEYIKTHVISALFLDMGLGKTVVTLTALRDLMFDELAVSKVLVITDKNDFGNQLSVDEKHMRLRV